MALALGIPARTQPTPLATILAPLLTLPVAPAKAASNTGPGVSYVPSIPSTAATTPAPTPAIPAVAYAPSMPVPTSATSPSIVETIAAPAAMPVPVPVPVPEVSYAPSLIAPATVVPPAIPETVAAVAPGPIAAVATPVLLPTEPASPPSPREPVAEPVAAAPAGNVPTSAPPPAASTGTATASGAAAQPSLLDLYRDATRTAEAHALIGFALPTPTITPTAIPLVRTGADLIADAAYALVAGADANRAGIGMLLDSVGAQASEESNRRTPDAKKPSALAA